MHDLNADNAIVRARHAMSIPTVVKAQAWRVERLDRAGEAYYLVVLGDDQNPIAVCAIDARTGATSTAARLSGGRPHLAIDSARARRIAGVNDARAELVWCPCQASLSPLYPFWRISGSGATVFVDQQGKQWDRLPLAHA